MLPPSWFYPFVAVFVVIMAVALLLQMAMMAGIFFAFRKLQATIQQIVDKQVQPLLDGFRSIADDARSIMREGREQVERFAETLDETQEMVRTQLARVDQLLTEATDRARLEIIRVDELVADTIHRVKQTTDFVQKGVVRPVKEMQAVAHGIFSAIEFLLNRGGLRRSPERATQDEELFI